MGARFSAPVQIGPRVHPASGPVVNYPSSLSAEVKERVELYLYSPSGPSWLILESTFPFLSTCLRIPSNPMDSPNHESCKSQYSLNTTLHLILFMNCVFCLTYHSNSILSVSKSGKKTVSLTVWLVMLIQ
jgi:hypothetical protein